MPMTVRDYIDLMEHALGRTPDTRHDLYKTFNRAGRRLYSIAEGPPWFHPWSWIVRDNVNFALPGNDVQVVGLPTDFGTLISVALEGAQTIQLVTTDMQNINELRRSNSVDPLRVYIAFGVGETQQTQESPPRKVAAFWPPRTSALTGLRISYRREWVDLLDTDDNRVPDFPSDYEDLMVMLARKMAIDLEDGNESREDQMIPGEIDRLVAKDAGRQTQYGRPVHSVRARAARGNFVDPFYGLRVTRP